MDGRPLGDAARENSPNVYRTEYILLYFSCILVTMFTVVNTLSIPMMPITSHSVAVVDSVESLGFVARTRRESLGLGLREAAPAAGVGTRFLSEFERGKPTAEVGKVLDALHALGLDLAVAPRAHATASTEDSYSQRLKTEFPYDWSNSRMSSALFIRKVLQAHRFNDMLKVVGHFGFDQVSRELATLGDPVKIEKAADILARIYKGMLLATAQDAAS